MDVKEDPYADTGEDDETALTGVVNPYFPKMRTWIKEHLDEAEEKVGVGELWLFTTGLCVHVCV